MTKAKPRKLSQADLRAMVVSPGLMAHRVGPDGRSHPEHLTAEDRPRPPFGPELTRYTNTSEGDTA